MKKTTILMLFMVCLIAFTGLTSAVSAKDKDKKIAVMWVGKSGMSKRMYIALKGYINEAAPEIHVDVFGNLKNLEKASELFNKFQSEYDAVVWFRGSGVKFLASAKPTIPTFVGACNNPKLLGAIKNLNAPEGMITGVTYFIPYQTRFDFIKQLFPRVRKVVLVAQRGHPSAPIDIEGTKRECEKRGIEYREVQGSTLEELTSEVKKIAGEVDLVILAENRLVQDATVNLLPITNKSGTPMFSYSEKPTKSGAVAGVVSRDTKRAKWLGDSIVDVLIRGKSIREVPVKMDDEPRLVINKSMADLHGIEVPEALVSKTQIVK